MLINFTVENFKSFKDKTTFSMISSYKIKKQEEHLINPIDNLSLLPITAIYGANAAGKSNIIKATMSASNFVIGKPLNYTPFKLDYHKEKASFFSFLFVANNNIYEYSFSINDKIVEQEKLVLVHHNGTEEQLFLRNKENLELHYKYNGEKATLDVLFKGTKASKLFITNLEDQNNKIFNDVYDWFKNLLIIESKNKIPQGNTDFFDENNELNSEVSSFLNRVDTGISKLSLTELEKYVENIDIGSFNRVPEQWLINELKNEGDFFGINNYRFSKINNEVMVQKKCIIHNGVALDLEEESDGTQYMIRLLPLFFKLKNRVIICDEIDNSLHPKLLIELITLYLEKNENHSNQLIFTTHTSTLLSSGLFRRDELIAVNKKNDGSSYIESFSDYVDSLDDNNLEKSYLTGRLGGIPRI